MADIEHKDISDPEIHEPKGVSTASQHAVYVATGLGTGIWQVASTTTRGVVALIAPVDDIADSTGGTAANGLTAMTNIALLVDSTGGTADNTVSAIVAPTDTPASADALRDDIAAVMIPALNNNFKELTEELIAQRALNTKLIDAIAALADKQNEILSAMRVAGLLTT